MLDINFIRENADRVKDAVIKKRKTVDIDYLLTLDDKRKSLQFQIDEARSAQKKAGEARDMDLAKSLKDQIMSMDKDYNDCLEEYTRILKSVPNVFHEATPIGKDEDENVSVRQIGTIPSFDFSVLDHQDLGERLWLLDKEQAVKVTGARFFYLKWDLAMLQYAIVQFTFSVLTNTSILADIIKKKWLSVSAKPFEVVIPPLMIHYETAEKMGRLHPMEDRYCLDQDQFMLVGSAEHSLGPIHMDQVLEEETLPRRYVAYTPCFRREAGTYGKDTRGILRTHQFDKIEMETFTTKEMWYDEQELIIAIQEYLITQLGLAYEVMMICTGDMGAMDYRQVDMNTRIPSQGKYRETHTSDYMTDYQARRLNIKVNKKNGDKEFVHMNDATAFALGRIIIAIMENNQNADGSINIPAVLQPYMGKTKIG